MVHTYKLNGFNIVLDVNSGAVHIVDNCTYDIINMLNDNFNSLSYIAILNKLKNSYSDDEIKEAYDEVKSLYDDDMLFSSGEEYDKFINYRTDNIPIKAMCLNVAHDCNLRCEYCFASKGDFGGKRELMSLETGKKAIDFLIKNSGTRRNIELDFFGGEPLMNFDVVKGIVSYARNVEKQHNKNFRFTITTNGLLLDDDKIDYINKEMSNVVLSLDGRKDINDLFRKTENKKGSYDIIVPKFKRLVDTRGDKDYYIRGTFTKHNLDFTNDVLHFADLGFKQLSIEPVVSDEKLEYSIKEEDLPVVFAEYEKLAKEIIKARKEKTRDFNFFHFMIDLDQGPCVLKRMKGCGCASEYVAVTPNGDIYPCHQFVGIDKWILGNLYEGILRNDIRTDFAKLNIFTKETCKNCWAKFYCSGGCAANSMKYEKDLSKPHKLSCDLERKRIECSIMILAALQDE